MSFKLDGGLKKCESFLYNSYDSPNKNDIRKALDSALLETNNNDITNAWPFGIDYLERQAKNNIEEEQAQQVISEKEDEDEDDRSMVSNFGSDDSEADTLGSDDANLAIQALTFDRINLPAKKMIHEREKRSKVKLIEKDDLRTTLSAGNLIKLSRMSMHQDRGRHLELNRNSGPSGLRRHNTMRSKRMPFKRPSKWQQTRKEIEEKLLVGTKEFNEEQFNKKRRKALRIMRHLAHKLKNENASAEGINSNMNTQIFGEDEQIGGLVLDSASEKHESLLTSEKDEKTPDKRPRLKSSFATLMRESKEPVLEV